MSFVNAQFVLPSVTQANGSIALWPRPAGRCPVTIKKRVQSSTSRTIRYSNPLPLRLGSLGWNPFSLNALKGAAAGFLTAGPAGAVAGAVGGRIQDAQQSNAKKQSVAQQAAQQQQTAAQSSGPLSNISTSTLVVGGLAFSALILTLARGGR